MQEPTLIDLREEVTERFPSMKNEIITHNQLLTDPHLITSQLQGYESLPQQERVKVVKDLAIMLEQLGEEGVTQLPSIIQKILRDKESISSSLVDRFSDVTKYLERHQSLESNLKVVIIPALIALLNSTKAEVKEKAGKELGHLAPKLSDQQERGDYVLKHIIEMAHDQSNEENRIVAVQLFSSMSECFGSQLCEQFVAMEILSLGEDTSFKVRKEAIKHLPVFCRLVQRKSFSRLFQFYIQKSKQTANWVIRKACVDNLIEMGEVSAVHDREGPLTQMLLLLLRDSQKSVRLASYKMLGRFIHLLKGGHIHEQLITQYCKMVEGEVNNLGKDNEVAYSCAFHLPGVLDALGPNSWIGVMWKVYEKLYKSNDKVHVCICVGISPVIQHIKQTMSESLHQVAKILGSQLTEKYLFRVIDFYVKDKNDDIKLGMIKHMADIMGVLPEKKRQEIIGVFQQFQKDQKKWRIRETIVKQLGKILEIYRPQIIFEYVLPILLKLCSDTVSIVRELAAKAVCDFIKKLTGQQGYHLGLIESVKAFGTSIRYTQRQAFLTMCEGLMNQKELFLENFMDILVALANDKVVNVKLVLANIVQNHYKINGCLKAQESFIKLYENLKNDQNEDVKIIFEE